MKKLLAMLLSATLMFSLAACGGGNTTDETAENAEAVKIGVSMPTPS